MRKGGYLLSYSIYLKIFSRKPRSIWFSIQMDSTPGFSFVTLPLRRLPAHSLLLKLSQMFIQWNIDFHFPFIEFFLEPVLNILLAYILQHIHHIYSHDKIRSRSDTKEMEQSFPIEGFVMLSNGTNSSRLTSYCSIGRHIENFLDWIREVSFYNQALVFKADIKIPRIKIPKPTSQEITRNEKTRMRAWAKTHGKSIR